MSRRRKTSGADAVTDLVAKLTLKLGVQGKQHTAGWDLDYLETIRI